MLEDAGNTCCVYTEKSLFYEAVANMKKAPDLLLLDYLVFNHDTFNVYRYLEEINRMIPLLFYNDPLPSPETRVRYWQMMLSLYYSDTSINLTLYTPLLGLLAQIIGSDTVLPYLSLLQPPRPYTACGEETTAQHRRDLLIHTEEQLFTAKHHRSTQHALYKILQENGEKPVSISELHRRLEEKNIFLQTSTIYAELSRLRSYIRKKEVHEIDICRTRTGYSLFAADGC
jgi:hypothetical protein